jgi:ATP-binding cassette subfamily B protein/subfamily B ATP-binding cassette protein MsbA
VAWALRLWKHWLEITVGSRLTFHLGAALLDHLQRLSLSFHARSATGDLVKRVTTDCSCVKSLMMDFAVPVATSTLTLFGILFVLWRISPILSVVALIVTPCLFFVIRAFKEPMTDRSFHEYTVQGELMALAERTLSAIPMVQAFGREPLEEHRFVNLSERMGRAHLSTVRKQLHFKLIGNAVLAFGTAGVMGLGGVFVLNGALTLGDLVVFLDYLLWLYDPLSSLAYQFGAYTGAAAAAQRVLPVLSSDEHVPEPIHPVPVPARVQGLLQFEDVHFAYSPDRPILQGISVSLHPGEIVALVGPTGAGKSTLVSLIPRLHDCRQGRVLLDGVDVRHWAIRDLRAQVSMVLQEPFLLPLSVRENIAYGKPAASFDEIQSAAIQARADGFIRALPQGYETVLGERGITLSGGERQRIAIARAFLKDAPILILDEATAALDTESEAAVMAAIADLTRGRTTILIAHRPSSARRASRIVALREGRLAPQEFAEALLAGKEVGVS